MKKMCFSERFGLQDAVLESRKTQTRRLIPQSTLAKIEAFQQEYYEATLDRLDGIVLLEQYYIVEGKGKLPFKVGDIVAVAQSYKDCGLFDIYRGPEYTAGWTNKMFVRAELMPHQIRITRMWFEYLQDISNEDCLKEGIDKWTVQRKRYYGFFDNEKGVFSHHPTPRDAYAHLIDRISGKGTWASNPIVIAYEFEKVK